MIKTPLWPHQREISDYIVNNKKALINVKMGLGKTLATLDAIDRLSRDRQLFKVLVLCPKAVMPVWKEEIDKHTDDFAAVVAGGSTKERADQLLAFDANKNTGVWFYIVNYASFKRGALLDTLRKRSWGMIVADEGHRLKSHNSKQSRAATKLSADHKVILTGTPFPNGLQDVFGQARFLDEDIFGTRWTKFRDEYFTTFALPNEPRVKVIDGIKDYQGLQDKISEFMLVVHREDLKIPVQHIYRTIKLSPKARRVYDEIRDDYISEIASGTITIDNVLVKLTRLHQAAGGFVKTDDGVVEHIDKSKLDSALEVVEDTGAEPLVIFCKYRAEIEALHKYISETALELSGKVNQLASWQNGDARILIVQIQSGSEGVDFSRASYGVYFSNSFSYGLYEQSKARLARPREGSFDRGVVFYHLIAENTVDETIEEALRNKEDISSKVYHALRRVNVN